MSSYRPAQMLNFKNQIQPMKTIIISFILVIPLIVNAQTWNYTSTNTRYPIIGEFLYSGGNEYAGHIVLPHFRVRNMTGSRVVNQFWGKDANGDLRWFNLTFNAENKVFSFSGQQADASIYFKHNVGIGTEEPDAMLSVAGQINAREVKVTVDAGADFVFDEAYPLRSLEETEQFIFQNNHLPDIASEEEMLREGIEVGDMNIRLLQKIEELTRYLIDQNKQLKLANQKIDQLQEEVAALKDH